jgi:hypothetical protein
MNVEIVTNPKVFISYAWTNDEYSKEVATIAERLVNNGIDVLFDKWELSLGKNKYPYMEKSVADNTVSKVLIFCNQDYKSRADNRILGVGDETVIISAEVYKKKDSTKFIPIVMEHKTNGETYIPTYLEGKIYVDLSRNNPQFVSEYEKLVRDIWSEPEIQKPKLGQKLIWLQEINENLGTFISIRESYSRAGNSRNKQNQYESQFLEELKIHLGNSLLVEEISGFLVYDSILKLKDLRDQWLLFIQEMIVSDNEDTGFRVSHQVSEITNFIHQARSNLHNVNATENLDYFIWESFICITALFIQFESFLQLRMFLNQPYVNLSGEKVENGYVNNDFNFSYLEQQYKPSTDKPRLFTLAGDLLVNRREFAPFITKHKIVLADIILYQLSEFCLIKNPSLVWFPKTCVYDYDRRYWQKLYSKNFCKKVFPLFDVSNIDQLKNAIQKCKNVNPINCYFSCESLPKIIDLINIDNIGTFD